MRISSILLVIASLELSRYPGRASRVIPKSSQSANFLLRLNRRQRTILRHVSPSGFAQTRTLASAANSTQLVIDRYPPQSSTGGRKITWLFSWCLPQRYHRALQIERQDLLIALSFAREQKINFNRSTTHRSRANGVRLFCRRIVVYWHLSELPVYVTRCNLQLIMFNQTITF